MKFSNAQYKWLAWLHDCGGRGEPFGLVIKAGGRLSGTGAPICFLNLLVKGAVRIDDGLIVITDYGCRVLDRGPPP